MVFGFPGSTKEYLTSFGVELLAQKENPVKIMFRQKRLDIIEAAMSSDRKTRIQYASKHAGIANGWKKMIGESRGVDRLNTIDHKRELEDGFKAWSAADHERTIKYGLILNAFEKTYQRFFPYDLAGIFISEGFQGIELLKFTGTFKDLISLSSQKSVKPEVLKKTTDRMRGSARNFFKDYQVKVDKDVASSLLQIISEKMNPEFKPAIFMEIEKKYSGNLEEYVEKLYSTSIFTDSTELLSILNDPVKKNLIRLKHDIAYLMAASFAEISEKKINPVMSESNRKIDSLQRIYIAGQMQYQTGRLFYPDANSGMRISYGKADDYGPSDAVTYLYFTTTKGILQKENPAKFDYVVEPRLKELINKQEYGNYCDKDGTMHVAFIASNHTSGGNSGSPVLDGKGRLIGLNFDRNWEGTVSDLQYDPELCRNITLDIRYCLFIIDRFAGAKRIIDEMNLVND